MSQAAMQPMSTKALLEYLRGSYIRPNADMPGGIFVSEVGENGEFGSSQRCDALYAGFTSASGRILVGHELKVSRADWRHELDNPAKADKWADACHEWWVVAPSTAIVEPETVPAGWGLMIPDPRGRTRMKRVIKAERKPSTFSPPWWAVRSIMSRQDTLSRKTILDTIQQRSLEIHEKAYATARASIMEGRRLAESERIVNAFAEVGIDLSTYAGFNRRDGRTSVGPDDLTPLLEIIEQYREVERIRQALVGRFGSLPQVADRMQQLVSAVEAMGSAP